MNVKKNTCGVGGGDVYRWGSVVTVGTTTIAHDGWRVAQFPDVACWLCCLAAVSSDT